MSFLEENKDSIVAEINQNSDYLRKQNLLFRALNKNTEPLFEDRLQHVHSLSMREHMRNNRTNPNYYRKSVKKISGIFSFETEIEFSDNQAEFDWYIENTSPEVVLSKSNFLTNGLGGSLIEIYFKKDWGLKYRAIPMDRIWLWSNDPLDPNEPQVYVKLINDISLSLEDQKAYSSAQCYYMYTDDEFMKVDCYHKKGSKEIEVRNGEAKENPLGFAPFVYCSYDDFNLIPELDSSSFDLAVGPGFDFTNASVAGYFQSFPIRYIINGPEDLPAELSINPDDLLQLHSEEGSDTAPEFGELASSLDLTKVLELIKAKVEDFFYCRDCPIKKDAVADKSGLALMIESVDTLENKMEQIIYYKMFMSQFYNKIAKYHNYLLKNRLEDLPEDYPRKAFVDKRIKVDVEFQLPSAEAEQAKEMTEDSDKPKSKSSDKEDDKKEE